MSGGASTQLVLVPGHRTLASELLFGTYMQTIERSQEFTFQTRLLCGNQINFVCFRELLLIKNTFKKNSI